MLLAVTRRSIWKGCGRDAGAIAKSDLCAMLTSRSDEVAEQGGHAVNGFGSKEFDTKKREMIRGIELS
jgi:hypothetical protein